MEQLWGKEVEVVFWNNQGKESLKGIITDLIRGGSIAIIPFGDNGKPTVPFEEAVGRDIELFPFYDSGRAICLIKVWDNGADTGRQFYGNTGVRDAYTGKPFVTGTEIEFLRTKEVWTLP